MKLGLLLIALGVGYKVYADASKEKGTLRSLGQGVGTIIMAVSLAVTSLFLYAYFSAWTSGKGLVGCPFAQKAALVAPSK